MDCSSHILFCKKHVKGIFDCSTSTTKSKSAQKLNNTLFLLSKSCRFQIFDYMPKQFIISTKDRSGCFNIDLLKDTSPVIYDFLEANPNNFEYFLNIDDEENVLGKFEKLYQGINVKFTEDDIPTSQILTKSLKITNCPNYLKLESLHCNEIDSKGHSVYSIDLKSGVEMNKDSFINFLSKEHLRKFTFITNSNKYECNIFGIYSSNIICNALKENSSLNQYVYDFKDENEEFRSIQDFFNFKHVEITGKNMNVLKKIAEELQITIILKQINDFIKKYNKKSEIIKGRKTIDDLFNWLYNIKTISVETVKDLIIKSNWINSKENVQELAAFILQVIKKDSFLHQEIADLLTKLNEEANKSNSISILIPFINEKLSVHNKYTFQFIYILYKRGIYPREEITMRIENFSFEDRNFQNFFLPEIFEIDSKNFDLLLNNIDTEEKYAMSHESIEELKSYLKFYFPNKVDCYKKMLENFEPDDELTQSLRHDDLDRLILIISKNKIDIPKALVPYNIFDNFYSKLSLINYAAMFGSIKCFEYLLMNNGIVDEETLHWANHSCNIEIIKLIDLKLNTEKENKIFDFSKNSNVIKESIVKHQNELFDLIFDKNNDEQNITDQIISDIASISASNGNLYPILKIMEKGYVFSRDLYKDIIMKAAQKGFCKLTQILLRMMPKRLIKKNNSILYYFQYESFISFGNYAIFESFIKKISKNDIKNILLSAIGKFEIEIINYIFNNCINKVIHLKDYFVIDALNASLIMNNDQCFELIMNKFKNLYPKTSKLLASSDLLNKACQVKNLVAVQIITEQILKINPKYDFTNEFNEAVRNSNKICKYFLDKKVLINFEVVALSIYDDIKIKETVFSAIFNNVSTEAKEELLKHLYLAIKNKNKSVIKILLEKNARYKSSLIDAVSTNDIEIVELILKYHGESYFNNQKDNISALFIAINNYNQNIVERLLLIPRINLNMKNESNKYPLCAAIENRDLEIVNTILNYYGNEFQSDMCLVADIMETLIGLFTNKNCIHKKYYNPNEFYSYNSLKKNKWDIVKRIFEIKNIDPNFSDQGTFLYHACIENKIEMVEFFLKLDKIDVNKYECKTGKTPLIGAIMKGNVKIAEILINYPKTNINCRDFDKNTPLTKAVANNQKDVIDLLIKDKRFNPKESRLNYAFLFSTGDISKQLIRLKDLDINHIFICSSNEKNTMPTFLTYCAQTKDIDKIDLILNHPLFDKDKSNIFDALLISIKNNDVDIFSKLLNVYSKTSLNNGESFLLHAIQHSSNEIIKAINCNPKFNNTFLEID